MEPVDDNSEGYRMRALEALDLLRQAMVGPGEVDSDALHLALAAAQIAALLSISTAVREGPYR